MINVMEGLSALLQMGGYGGYVWPAYGIGAVLLGLVLVVSILSARRAEAELDLLQQSRKARRAAPPSPES
jgi:heme exporter protein D